ncbi:MAG: FesM [Chloroflexota bacterium]|nr:FesM [Chloroflexota bacterium]
MAVPRTQPSTQRDLLNLPVIGSFLRWKHARTSMQAVLLAVSALILYDGFWGPQLAPKNLAGVLPWVHWRGLVVLALLIAGNIFCMACPFMLPRRLAKKLLPANRRWPKVIRNKWLALGVLLVFFWAYEAFDLWASPWLTAWVALTYFVAAFAIDGIFRGAAFCKYVCPIGQFHFVHGMVSPLEVKVRQPDLCGSCPTKDCIKGRYAQRPEPDVLRHSRETNAAQDSPSLSALSWSAKSHPHPDPLPQGRGSPPSLGEGIGVPGKSLDATRGNSNSEPGIRHSRASGNPSSAGRVGQEPAPTTSESSHRESKQSSIKEPKQAERDIAIPAGLQLVQTGCELWLFQERKVGNMDCTFCLDCIQACPYDNVGIQLRAPTSEFRKLDQLHSGVGALAQRIDLAALVYVLVFAAFVNAFGMVAPVYALEQWLAGQLGVTSEPVVLGVLFIVGLVALPFVLVTAAAWSSRALSGSRETLAATATRFSFALIPIGFGMWLAHYGFHFLIGALTAIPVTQSFLADFGVILLGAPQWELAAIVPDSWLVPLELLLLELGMLVSLTVGYRIARKQHGSMARAIRALLPWAVIIVLLFFTGAWMMTQPMEMRGIILG